MSGSKRLAMAMGGLAALGILTWTTLDDPRIRYATLAILALFALKTWLRRNDTMHADREKTEQ
jgi:hypothetical protein